MTQRNDGPDRHNVVTHFHGVIFKIYLRSQITCFECNRYIFIDLYIFYCTTCRTELHNKVETRAVDYKVSVL